MTGYPLLYLTLRSTRNRLMVRLRRLREPKYLLGTVIGMLPGILATVVFVDRIVEALRNPGAITFITLALVIAVMVGVMVALRRRLAGMAGGAQRTA